MKKEYIGKVTAISDDLVDVTFSEPDLSFNNDDVFRLIPIRRQTHQPIDKLRETFKDILEADMVTSPPHYNDGEIECLDAIASALGPDGFLSYCQGQIIKYTWRAGKKNDLTEDIRKAIFYAKCMIGEDPRYESSSS